MANMQNVLDGAADQAVKKLPGVREGVCVLLVLDVAGNTFDYAETPECIREPRYRCRNALKEGQRDSRFGC